MNLSVRQAVKNKSCEKQIKTLYRGTHIMKKRVLLSVAAATALTLGVSSLDAQAATVQPSNVKVQNIQHSKVMMKQMSQQELQAFLQSMGVESLAQWQQGNFQPNCFIPGQQPTENVVTEQPTAKPETQKPAEQKPAEQKPAEEVQKPEAQKPAENNNTQKPAEQKPAEQKPAEEAKSLSEFEQRVVELTNAERAKQGLPALKIDTELSKVARIKSEDMQKNRCIQIGDFGIVTCRHCDFCICKFYNNNCLFHMHVCCGARNKF